ncbi:MAG: hypothetical protein HYY93_14115 [Planctomycetes bacterium]|nr:hypothetical protein [Planctomycetota bacterium]
MNPSLKKVCGLAMAFAMGGALGWGGAFWMEGGSRRQVDNLDLAFIDDPAAVGRWRSVDFVETASDFEPGSPRWSGDLYLRELVLLPGGKSEQPWWTWTRGVIMHREDQTASHYEIREIEGSKYMFFEWKSGDYVIRHMKPCFYVLKREN